MKKLFFLLLALCTANLLFAQYVVSGRVIDAETKQPLQGASVFAQNTTSGTITNAEGAFRLSLGKGGFDINVTYTGYKNGQKTVQGSTDSLVIEMQKEDKSMSEVVITSSNEVADGWQQYGDFFVRHFIGATPFADSCTITNPEVLKFYFYKRSNKLKVFATEPLQIANKSLGYNLRYTLDSFVYYYGSNINSYRGLCLYQQMEGSNEDYKQWEENRKKAYYGSRLHFLRAYYDSTLKESGFTVDILSKDNKAKFNRVINPYDTAYYLVDSVTNDVEVWFPRKASITYYKNKPEAAYLKQYNLPADVGIQISYVDLADAILIQQNGFFTDQKSWTAQGYWSWKNLADQLPYDYEPKE